MDDAPPPPPGSRCGFAALVGAPNAGKSTLVNRLVGAKVSIVTPKAQTTRTRIRGVAVVGAAQSIYVDTPGIFSPRNRLDRAMVAAAWSGAADADEVVLLVDARRGVDGDVGRIVDGLRRSRRQAILALNKTDTAPRAALLDCAARLHGEGVFTEVFMISALTGDGVDDLRRALADRMPDGPWLYPEDRLSDLHERLFAAEVTREQLFLQLRRELPYALTVESERWEEFADGGLRIEQTIYVERGSQKAIVLGKAGRRIKAVREAAASELAAQLDRRVHLFLFVKVRPDWRDDPERFRALGLDAGA